MCVATPICIVAMPICLCHDYLIWTLDIGLWRIISFLGLTYMMNALSFYMVMFRTSMQQFFRAGLNSSCKWVTNNPLDRLWLRWLSLIIIIQLSLFSNLEVNIHYDYDTSLTKVIY